MKPNFLFLVVALLLPIHAPPAATPPVAAVLVSDGVARCTVVTNDADPLMRRTAAMLVDYFDIHTGTKPRVGGAVSLTADRSVVQIVIDGGPGQPLLARLGLAQSFAGDRADAYRVNVTVRDGQTIVVIAGATPAGAKFGTYRFMEEMDLGPGRAAIGALDVSAAPFFKTRSVSLFNIWRVPVEVIRQCNLESWPVEKIARNVDMYDAFGFNALETHDRFHEDFLQAVYGLTRAEWRAKVYALCDAAHGAGMTVFLRQWANSVALQVKELKGGYTPFGFENLVPDIPEERRRWEVEIRDYVVQNYAAHIDHFIGHWADAGGIHAGSHATIEDALRLHNELRAALRAVNPRIETTFNLWGMANPKGHRGWPGYVDERSVTGGILEKDVIIAQTTRSRSHAYSAEATNHITSAGYRAAVWTWRRADTEVRLGDPGLRIRIHGVMGDYFHGLPESARELEWHNIERNQHGVATDVNYYVAGKLMWDPKADVDAALKKYCALVFGPTNVAPLAEAFLTIEATRDVEQQVSPAVVADPVSAANRARRVLAAVAQITLPAGHHSRLPSVISPVEMLEEIRSTLAVIIENAELCARQLPELDRLIKGGQMEEAKAKAAELRRKADAWFGTIAGGMEGLWLKDTVAAKMAAARSGAFKGSDSRYRINPAATVEKTGEGITLAAKLRETGFALLELPAPVRQRLQVSFQCRVADNGKSRNGGFAFGPDEDTDELVTCQVLIGGREVRIRGAALTKPIRTPAPNLDPSRPLECVATVDLAAHRVTFKVGEYTAEAVLKPGLREIRTYGLMVEGARTQFAKMNVDAQE
jgi:hypothetical protein